MKYQYKNRKGFHITKIEAEVVGCELEKIFPSGQIEPEFMVQAAKKNESPLHKFFEWDDVRAAHAHRLDQARNLLRSIVVVLDDKEIPVYHNVRISADSPNVYMDVYQCKSTPALWDQVLSKALEEAKNWAARYKGYQEFEPIHSAIEVVMENLGNEEETRNPDKPTARQGRDGNDQHTKA